jgi:hypothetical protein
MTSKGKTSAVTSSYCMRARLTGRSVSGVPKDVGSGQGSPGGRHRQGAKPSRSSLAGSLAGHAATGCGPVRKRSVPFSTATWSPGRTPANATRRSSCWTLWWRTRRSGEIADAQKLLDELNEG